jgi:hypothetical protein
MRTLCPSGAKKLSAAAICGLFLRVLRGKNCDPAGAAAIRRLNHAAD